MDVWQDRRRAAHKDQQVYVTARASLTLTLQTGRVESWQKFCGGQVSIHCCWIDRVLLLQHMRLILQETYIELSELRRSHYILLQRGSAARVVIVCQRYAYGSHMLNCFEPERVVFEVSRISSMLARVVVFVIMVEIACLK